MAPLAYLSGVFIANLTFLLDVTQLNPPYELPSPDLISHHGANQPEVLALATCQALCLLYETQNPKLKQTVFAR